MKFFATLLFLLISLSAVASPIKIKQLNNLIEKKHAGWVARDTSVSGLNDYQIKRLFGSLDVPDEQELFQDRGPLGKDAIDWRNINGINWVGPVMNQGNCGSCVAFAAVATLETQFRISSGLPWLMPTFSPQQLFSCGGGGCDLGWMPDIAVSALKSKGIVDLACSPYLSGSTGQDLSCKEIVCTNQAERTYRITDSKKPSSIFGGSAAKVKAALKNGPLITTMKVREDFLSYGSGIYKTVGGRSVGGHAISIVGFNDEGRYWIIRNSWGTDWGENGFARISYDDPSGIANSTWSLETKQSSQLFAIQSPSNHQYVTGDIKVEVKSGTPLKTQVIIAGEADTLDIPVCENQTNTECQTTLDTTKLKDGRYEIYAKYNSEASQVKEFYVLNHRPNSTVSFTAERGEDISKPISGRMEFEIDVKASPIMPASLTFIVEDMSGKIIAQRLTDTVVPQMKLGFRFNTIPTGKYKIYYIAETPFQGTMVRATSNIETITTKN